MKIIVLDAEYDVSSLNFKTGIKKGERLISYSQIFMGAYNGAQYQIFKIQDIHDSTFTSIFLDWINSQSEKEFLILSFFSIAELQFFNFSQSDKVKSRRIIPINDKVYNMDVNLNNGKKLYFRDLMKLTNASSLDSLLKGFGIKSSKDYLKERNINIKELFKADIEVIKEYNKLDCECEYQAYMIFKQCIENIYKDLNIEFNEAEFYQKHSLGSIAMDILKKIAIRNKEIKYFILDEKLAEKTGIDQRQFDFNKEMYDKFADIYQGGGIIHNLTPLYSKSKFLENITLLDIKSLYPYSAIIASHELDLNNLLPFLYEWDWAPIERVEEFVKDERVKGFIWIDCEVINKECLLLQIHNYEDYVKKFLEHKEDTMIARKFLSKKFRGCIYLDELRIALQEGWITNVKYRQAILWRVSNKEVKIRSIKEYYEYMMSKKEQASEEGNEAMKYLFKMLSNILYGKLVEKDNEKIKFYLFGAMITAISRVIMMRLTTLIRKQGYRVFHLATDSIMTDMPLERLQTLNNFKLLHPQAPDKEAFEIQASQAHCYILKLKTYIITPKPFYSYDSYEQIKNEKIKEAHHAVSSQVKDHFWSCVLQSVKDKDPFLELVTYNSPSSRVEDSISMRLLIKRKECNMDNFDYYTADNYSGFYEKSRLLKFTSDLKFKVKEDHLGYYSEPQIWEQKEFNKELRKKQGEGYRLKKLMQGSKITLRGLQNSIYFNKVCKILESRGYIVAENRKDYLKKYQNKPDYKTKRRNYMKEYMQKYRKETKYESSQKYKENRKEYMKRYRTNKDEDEDEDEDDNNL